MGILDIFRSKPPAPTSEETAAAARVMASAAFYGIDDPLLREFMTSGRMSKAGIAVSVESAMRNPSVYRCVSLIAQIIGMLPLHMIDKDTKERAKDHPLFEVLHRKPNDWQTAFDFRMLMQLRALVKKNAYALIIRSRVDKTKILRLVPLDPDRATSKMQNDWTLRYEYRPASGATITYRADEIFHLRGLSMDGINGLSLVEQAADAIGLAIAADLAASRVFKNGAFVPGTLNTPRKIGEVALRRLKVDWKAMFSGADNAGETPVLEEGLEYKAVGTNPKDAQHNELRGRQVEEIARIFGVPRPLLMMDDTSWGSGIEVLGEFFVRFGLGPWFVAWEQAIERSLLSEADAKRYEVKFNDGALTRGSLKDQAENFAKASGSGGHKPWMTANEIRDLLNMPRHKDGDGLEAPGAEANDAGEGKIGHNGGPPLDDAGAAA